MHIVICLDDKNGILFNSRRVSSDIAVCQRVLQQHTGRLMMNSYSAKLFSDDSVCVDEDFLQNAGEADTCFVENLDFTDRSHCISAITIYRWNRHYPSDVKLPRDFLTGWTLLQTEEFAGNSHETITEERYIK